MTGKNILGDRNVDLLNIGASKSTLIRYAQIADSLENFNVIDHFYQIRKSDTGDGLAFEVMIFNQRIIHDIVVTSHEIEYISVLLKAVNSTIFTSSFELSKELGTKSDSANLTISYGGDLKELHYVTNNERFDDLLRVKNTLMKLISE